MNTTILSKAQADALFRREAVLMGTADAIPEGRAVELFGEDAVKFACRTGGSNGYGIGDYTAMYLTYKGFLTVISYHNAVLLKAQTQKEAAPSDSNTGDGKAEHV